MNHSVQQSYLSPDSEDEPSKPKSTLLHKKFLQILQNHSGLNPDQAFYLQYCKLYIEVIKKQSDIKIISQEIEQLKDTIDSYSSKPKRNSTPQISNEISNTEKRKRIRRTANQIARHYVCQVEKCQKSYGSQGSLNQHIKLKHKELLGTLGFPNENIE